LSRHVAVRSAIPAIRRIRNARQQGFAYSGFIASMHTAAAPTRQENGMKDINSAPGSTSFSAFWNELCAYTRQGMAALRAMSWPMLLVCCLGLAFLITILPLAIMLFALVMLLRWASNSDDAGADQKASGSQQSPQ